MNDRRNWQKAFLRQARVDWEAYQRTREAPWPECHRLLFLQMATEKLGKALLVAGHSSLDKITQTHAAFVKFLQVAGNHRKLKRALGMKPLQQSAQFKALLPFAREIELLAPALAQHGPNPEYPWPEVSGNIVAPADHLFPLTKRLRHSPQGIQLLKYIDIFLHRFEDLFM